jgi:hypothetical protein
MDGSKHEILYPLENKSGRIAFPFPKSSCGDFEVVNVFKLLRVTRLAKQSVPAVAIGTGKTSKRPLAYVSMLGNELQRKRRWSRSIEISMLGYEVQGLVAVVLMW